MNYPQLQSYIRQTSVAAALLMSCFAFIIFGLFFAERSSCRLSDYIYESGRLATGQPGVICKMIGWTY